MSEPIVEPIENFGLSQKDRKRSMFSKIGIVGAGIEGRNIAGITASAGLDVVFVDLESSELDLAFEKIGKNLDSKIENWGLTASEKKTVLSRIKGTTSYSDLKDCDFVIECTRHDDETGQRSTKFRKEVFLELEKVLSPEAIIATNASTVVVTELASDLIHKERCISLHFLVSQPEARILEIVKGLYTTDEVYRKVLVFTKMIKHDVINVQESSGLVSIRMFLTMLNEGCQMLMENVATIEDIDKLLRMGWGFRRGIFRIADLIGIEKVVSLMENMFSEYGDKKYKPNPLIMKLYRAKQYGIRTKKGFYIYDDKGNAIKGNTIGA
ncbi:MAG: 3-hydroxyacyl-CoA dehydrogenase family protein [Bacteroidales bacterium]|nr:3-hydroxyacyl-CoA dehydrogenase family protein [Bacteroidales bacterium]